MKNVISFIVLVASMVSLSCLDGEKSNPTSTKTQTEPPSSSTSSVKPHAAYCDDGAIAIVRIGQLER